jgi:ABC-2 type transport system permease protein
MSVLLMPMWLLSGAFFPVPSLGVDAHWSESALHWVMRINPLSYAVAGARHLVGGVSGDIWSPSLATCWVVTCGFAVVMFVAAVTIAGKRSTGDAV